jgi:hypothetical protein
MPATKDNLSQMVDLAVGTQFIRVLQSELSFDNNIPTQYFRFNHKFKKTLFYEVG